MEREVILRFSCVKTAAEFEKDSFSWKERDIYFDLGFTFYDVELRENIGDFKKGDKFEWVNLNFEQGAIIFPIDDGAEGLVKYKLKIAIDLDSKKLVKIGDV